MRAAAECDIELDDDWPEVIKQAFRDDYAREQREKRSSGNGIYQGRKGLRERRAAPALGWWRDRLHDLHPLCSEVFAPLRYAVPYLIPEGVTLLVGRPKIKKSFMLLQIACAIAKGDITLVAGNGEPPPHGDVLYLALEDNKRRLQDRVTSWYGACEDNWPRNFQYALEWLRLDEGGLDGIGEWCATVPKPRLVVIDTLARVRPPKQHGQTDYEADMEAAAGLTRLCAYHGGLSVICAHHDRKQDADDPFDTVSGTLGLTGGVDTIAMLKRNGLGVTLHVRGRDLKEDVKKAVSFDDETCRWQILGEADEVRRSAGRKLVLDMLATCGTLTPRQLADRAESISYANAKQMLWRMARDGLIGGDNGIYRLHQESGVTAVTALVSPD